MKKRILAAIIAASVAAASLSVTAFAEMGGSDYTDNTSTAVVTPGTGDVVVLSTEDGVLLDVNTIDLPEGVEEVTFSAVEVEKDAPEVEFINEVFSDYIDTLDTDVTADDLQIESVYDFSFVDQNGDSVETTDYFSVSVPCDNEDVNCVIYTDGVGTIEFYRAYYAYGFINFTVPHFSTYALAVVPEEVLADIVLASPADEVIEEMNRQENADEDDDTADEDTAADDKNVATGVALAVVPAAIAGVAVVISRKRK